MMPKAPEDSALMMMPGYRDDLFHLGKTTKVGPGPQADRGPQPVAQLGCRCLRHEPGDDGVMQAFVPIVAVGGQEDLALIGHGCLGQRAFPGRADNRGGVGRLAPAVAHASAECGSDHATSPTEMA